MNRIKLATAWLGGVLGLPYVLFLVSFGDCAVTGSVAALRNPLGSAAPVLDRAYLEADRQPHLPKGDLVPP